MEVFRWDLVAVDFFSHLVGSSVGEVDFTGTAVPVNISGFGSPGNCTWRRTRLRVSEFAFLFPIVEDRSWPGLIVYGCMGKLVAEGGRVAQR